MSDETQRNRMTQTRVVHAIPAMAAVTVRRDHPYRATDEGPLTMDLYYPPGSDERGARPAVVFVTGFADRGAEMLFGARFKEMGSFVSWAQLAAASGLVGITYSNAHPHDVHDVLRHVVEHAAALGIDERHVGIWACSGHAPNALSLMLDRPDVVRCAVLAYPYTLDLDRGSSVAEAARQFRFVTPASGRAVADFPRDVPVFIARAGRDTMPGLNTALDRFVTAALAANLALTVVNHSTGPHAFDLFDDTAASRAMVAQMLRFLTSELSG